MTAWITVNLVAALMQYYLTYWMQMPGEIEIVLGLVQAVALVCIPLMVWLSLKWASRERISSAFRPGQWSC